MQALAPYSPAPLPQQGPSGQTPWGWESHPQRTTFFSSWTPQPLCSACSQGKEVLPVPFSGGTPVAGTGVCLMFAVVWAHLWRFRALGHLLSDVGSPMVARSDSVFHALMKRLFWGSRCHRVPQGQGRSKEQTLWGPPGTGCELGVRRSRVWGHRREGRKHPRGGSQPAGVFWGVHTSLVSGIQVTTGGRLVVERKEEGLHSASQEFWG